MRPETYGSLSLGSLGGTLRRVADSLARAGRSTIAFGWRCAARVVLSRSAFTLSPELSSVLRLLDLHSLAGRIVVILVFHAVFRAWHQRVPTQAALDLHG